MADCLTDLTGGVSSKMRIDEGHGKDAASAGAWACGKDGASVGAGARGKYAGMGRAWAGLGWAWEGYCQRRCFSGNGWRVSMSMSKSMSMPTYVDGRRGKLERACALAEFQVTS